jgi:hypothetical protein
MRADQHIVDRRGLSLGAAAFAVHPLQRQLDRLGFAGVGHPGGAMEGGDAGDIAPHRRRRLERRHGIDEGGDGCRRRGERRCSSVAAPGGEDRHVGAQRPLGVAGIGAACRGGVLCEMRQRAGLDFGRYRGLDFGKFGHRHALS